MHWLSIFKSCEAQSGWTLMNCSRPPAGGQGVQPVLVRDFLDRSFVIAVCNHGFLKLGQTGDVGDDIRNHGSIKI